VDRREWSSARVEKAGGGLQPPERERRIRANIVSWDGGGLGVDIDVLTRALVKAGCTVAFKGRPDRRPHGRLRSLAMTGGALLRQLVARAGLCRYDVNFFIESVFPEHLPTARVNCLFVNPEWFRETNLAHLSHLDILLCKTPGGVDAMRALPVACRDVGFTSPDRRLTVSGGGALRCLHIAGQSAVKGTEAVVDVWARHPEWPHLTIVRRRTRYGGRPAPALQALPNVEYLSDRVPDDELQALQNRCAIHIQPSLAEGYGHVIGEAMSCGALVVTTDAPPMNELVGPDRGLLVRVSRTEAHHRSQLNYVDLDDLERVLASAFAMPEERRLLMGQAARSWFERQDTRFLKAVESLLEDLGGREGRPPRPPSLSPSPSSPERSQ
jgi:Glycosyl transferases group 1